jgi:hypothetical protein
MPVRRLRRQLAQRPHDLLGLFGQLRRLLEVDHCETQARRRALASAAATAAR